MIITRLKLDPFGFFSNKEIAFNEGLNVILGPNEAGKSTAFHGLQKVLFTASKLTKPQYKSEKMERFCPLGGDTMHVELSFALNGNAYTLSKTWGGTKSAKLISPGGSMLTDDSQIAEELDKLFPATPGTFKAILMTYQSGLGRTLEELKTDHAETVQGLGDILRKAVFETDGVSIEQFKEKILVSHHEYFSHWDKVAQYPEKGRGIENEWAKEVGLILQAFYDKEKIASRLAETMRLEEEFDRINGKIIELSKAISEKDLYIQDNSKIVEGVKERRTLNAEKDGNQAKMDVIIQVNSDWPVRESKMQELTAKSPLLTKESEKLEQEKIAAEKEEMNRKLRDRFKKVSEMNEKHDEAQKALLKTKKLGKKEFEEIVDTQTTVERIKAGITAGKLSVTITALNDLGLSITKDLDAESAISIAQGNNHSIDAGGLVRLVHPDWRMEITSGKGSIQTLLDDFTKAEQQFLNLLQQHGVANVGDARDVSRIYEQQVKEVEKHANILTAELGEVAFEELKSQADALGKEENLRSLVDIITDLEQTKAEMKQLEIDFQAHKQTVGQYQIKYGDKTKLLLELAQCVAKVNNIEEKLGKLPAPPPGVDDLDTFTGKYDEALLIWSETKEKRDGLMIERARMEGEMPEVSAEELEKQLAEAEAGFIRVKRKGEAIARVIEMTEKVLGDLDSGSDGGIKKDVEEYVSHLTGKKYETVAMNETLPQGFVRKDGKTLPYDYLSAGTKDVFSIALRLAMANHFLKESKGFLVMDDPLVNMDPVRQKKASDFIKEYSKSKQILIFTCHPNHAELLGGNRIMLS
jgi:exonuclease SbcC